MSGPIIWREIGQKDEKAARSAENAYRRGYCHGMAYAAQKVAELYAKGGFVRPREIASIIDQHLEAAVRRWRGGAPVRSNPPQLRQKSWAATRREVFERDGRVCARCGSIQQLEIDHILPVNRGGLPDANNLRVLCKPCNLARNAKRG